MYFDSLHAALDMGGHGFYVWTAYSVTIVMIALVVIAPVLRRRRFLRQLAGQLKRAQVATAENTRGER
ncbi:MAG: heme exporter protein CcmD [Halioglobus sp.]|nr:heme exporter protein CcmD [Halioglobus sp.]